MSTQKWTRHSVTMSWDWIVNHERDCSTCKRTEKQRSVAPSNHELQQHLLSGASPPVSLLSTATFDQQCYFSFISQSQSHHENDSCER